MWVEISSLTCPCPKIYTGDNGHYLTFQVKNTKSTQLSSPSSSSQFLGRTLIWLITRLQQKCAGSFSGDLWIMELLLPGNSPSQAELWLGQFRPVVSEEGNGWSLESVTFHLTLCSLSSMLFVSDDAQRAVPALGLSGGELGFPGMQRNLSHAPGFMPCCLYGLVWCSPSSLTLNFCWTLIEPPKIRALLGWLQSLYSTAKAVPGRARLCCSFSVDAAFSSLLPTLSCLKMSFTRKSHSAAGLAHLLGTNAQSALPKCSLVLWTPADRQVEPGVLLGTKQTF